MDDDINIVSSKQLDVLREEYDVFESMYADTLKNAHKECIEMIKAFMKRKYIYNSFSCFVLRDLVLTERILLFKCRYYKTISENPETQYLHWCDVMTPAICQHFFDFPDD